MLYDLFIKKIFPLSNRNILICLVLAIIFYQFSQSMDGILKSSLLITSGFFGSCFLADIFVYNILREKILKLTYQKEIFLAWILFLILFISDVYYALVNTNIPM